MVDNDMRDRFWSKVDKSGSCWIWTGVLDRYGYGKFKLNGRYCQAQRVSWLLTHGSIADGLFVCHSCDNPACVRPDHLWLGNNALNMADMTSKGREAKGERHGLSKLTESEVIEIRRRYAAGGISHRSLAIEFGVHNRTIGQVVNRATWKHLGAG